VPDPAMLEVHDDNRVVVLKATVIGAEVDAPTAVQTTDEDREFYQRTNTVPPPYSPDRLLQIIENSSCLPQNIEAYVTNIDGLGHRLEPVVDLDSDEAREHVREAMWIDRVDQHVGTDAATDARPTDSEYDVESPSDEEVDALVARLKRAARVERARLTTFIDFANPNGSFTQLRRETRGDIESVGNAYWEVLRDARGRVARLVRVPPSTMRITALEKTPVEVEDRVPVGLTRWETLKQHRFFRRFVQVTEGTSRSVVWFKQFGDPRVVSRVTGAVYKDDAALKSAEPLGSAANEMIHFTIGRGGGGYGIPRWIGVLLAVLGTRAAEDVNYAYFDNKGVPPLALLVSGGRLAAESVEKITGFVENNLKGRANFHKILVIEAAPAEGDLPGNGQTAQLKFERLVDAQQGDALFLNYDERNADKVGSAFRLPRLLRGDVKDINRSTALASLRFADDQVFEPERMEFDGWMNRVLLPVLGVRLWRFRSLALRTRDPETMANVVAQMNTAGAIVPNESREIMADALGRELPPIDQEWARQPAQFTLAGYRPFSGDEMGTEEVTPAGAGAVGVSPVEGAAGGELRTLMADALRAARGREGVVAAARTRALAQDDGAARRDEVDDDGGSHEA